MGCVVSVFAVAEDIALLPGGIVLHRAGQFQPLVVEQRGAAGWSGDVTASATLSSSDEAVVRVVENQGIGALTLVEHAPDLQVYAGREQLAIAPGTSDRLEVTLVRNNGFSSRVPITVLNLPYGVRVLDTGLNGILVREGETVRGMEIFVEPWVEPGAHTLYIQARIESPSTGRMVFISQPVPLRIGGETVASVRR